MAKLAFLFPGQGSQKVGMGADLREAAPANYERYLDVAEEASGLPIRQLSQDGPMEELTRTDVAQPALFTLSLALADAARDAGLEAEFVAGHSLGEYTAAVAAGALAPEDGIRVVVERGRLMAGIDKEQPGAMAAVIGLESDTLAELCGRASDAGGVSLANLNSPMQTVVSGEVPGVERLMGLAEESGAKKVVRLQVGAAFHSELMKPVQERLAEFMEPLSWSDLRVPLASNASGRLVTSAEDVRAALIAQIASPVRWVDCVRTLREAGAERYVELGPGRVLGGLIRQIDPEFEGSSADSPEKLAAAVAA